jgi:GxxExxY protein
MPMSYPFSKEGFELIGAAFEVYNQTGYGMAEEVYQECLQIELELRDIPYQSKCQLSLAYKERPLTRRYVPDLLVYSGIVVELKSVKELVPSHEAQLFNYMRIAGVSVGYLINFGRKNDLEWKRYLLTDLHANSTSRQLNREH